MNKVYILIFVLAWSVPFSYASPYCDILKGPSLLDEGTDDASKRTGTACTDPSLRPMQIKLMGEVISEIKKSWGSKDVLKTLGIRESSLKSGQKPEELAQSAGVGFSQLNLDLSQWKRNEQLEVGSAHDSKKKLLTQIETITLFSELLAKKIQKEKNLIFFDDLQRKEVFGIINQLVELRELDQLKRINIDPSLKKKLSKAIGPLFELAYTDPKLTYCLGTDSKQFNKISSDPTRFEIQNKNYDLEKMARQTYGDLIDRGQNAFFIGLGEKGDEAKTFKDLYQDWEKRLDSQTKKEFPASSVKRKELFFRYLTRKISDQFIKKNMDSKYYSNFFEKHKHLLEHAKQASEKSDPIQIYKDFNKELKNGIPNKLTDPQKRAAGRVMAVFLLYQLTQNTMATAVDKLHPAVHDKEQAIEMPDAKLALDLSGSLPITYAVAKVSKGKEIIDGVVIEAKGICLSEKESDCYSMDYSYRYINPDAKKELIKKRLLLSNP